MISEYLEERDGGFYVKGNRVPLDVIVYEFRNGASPESIQHAYPTLSLEQVYGAVTFYLGHREAVERSVQEAERAWQEFEATHPIPQSLRERLHNARSALSPEREL
jgi:uncharacterized protein (DUF433 family)